MLLTSIALTLMAAQAPAPQFHCINVKQGAVYSTPSEIVDYKGVRYGTCCPGCAAEFMKDPEGNLKAEIAKGWTIGTSLFDPVTGKRIEEKDMKATTTYKGVVYYFAKKSELATFMKAPKKFTMVPAKQDLVCAVTGETIKGIAAADAYVDFKGVRYYTCCPMCQAPLKKDPAKYVGKVASSVTAADPAKVK